MSDLGLYRSLGSNLIYQGKMFLNKATPVKKTEYTASQILTCIREMTGLPVNKIYSADERHYTTDIETWKSLIEDDWTDTKRKEWITDTFDCDNFAGSFSSAMADIYGLNSCARVTVELRNPVTNEHIGWHRCCIIIDSLLNCWLLETQTDEMVKIEVGKFPVLRNWKYVFVLCDVN